MQWLEFKITKIKAFGKVVTILASAGQLSGLNPSVDVHSSNGLVSFRLIATQFSHDKWQASSR